MSKYHRLKIWPCYYEPVRSGRKKFEYRVNDRGFKEGDVVILKAWDPESKNYVPRLPELWFYVGYVLPVSDTHVVFSLVDVPEWTRKQLAEEASDEQTQET